MTTVQPEKLSGEHFTSIQLGAWEQLTQYSVEVPALPGRKIPGKLFLRDLMGLSGMEISVNKFPAGVGMPFHHTHKLHEEVYLFIRGKGQFQVDGEVIEVREGTVIAIAPGGKRVYRNNSSEDLYYLVIQAEQGSLTHSATEDGVISRDAVIWPE